MFTKFLTKFVPVLALSAVATVSQAAIISFSGTVESGSGGFEILFPAGMAIDGSLNYDTHLNAGQVIVGAICFTGDVSGQPSAQDPFEAGLAGTDWSQRGRMPDGVAVPGSGHPGAGAHLAVRAPEQGRLGGQVPSSLSS